MKLPNIKDLVRDDKKALFVRYQSKELWYRCEEGFEFPIPITDTDDGAFLAEHRAITLMRWIRKHLDFLKLSLEQRS